MKKVSFQFLDRRLDALIATHVFGWEVWTFDNNSLPGQLIKIPFMDSDGKYSPRKTRWAYKDPKWGSPIHSHTELYGRNVPNFEDEDHSKLIAKLIDTHEISMRKFTAEPYSWYRVTLTPIDVTQKAHEATHYALATALCVAALKTVGIQAKENIGTKPDFHVEALTVKAKEMGVTLC